MVLVEHYEHMKEIHMKIEYGMNKPEKKLIGFKIQNKKGPMKYNTVIS